MKKDKEKNPTPTQPETAPDETVQEPVIEPQDEAKEASIDEWRDALETAVKQRDEYLDSLRRTQADFQNFKRRNQTSRADVCPLQNSASTRQSKRRIPTRWFALPRTAILSCMARTRKKPRPCSARSSLRRRCAVSPPCR